MEKNKSERGGFSKLRFQNQNSSLPSEGKYHININTKTDFKAQRKKCEDIFNTGAQQIFLHSFGNAINYGINLALDLVNSSVGVLSYGINTSTINFVDENDSPCDSEELKYEQRYNSAVHIRIFRNKFSEEDRHKKEHLQNV